MQVSTPVSKWVMKLMQVVLPLNYKNSSVNVNTKTVNIPEISKGYMVSTYVVIYTIYVLCLPAYSESVMPIYCNVSRQKYVTLLMRARDTHIFWTDFMFTLILINS